MRISDSQRWGGYADRIRDTQAKMIQAQLQVTDGKRMHAPSDDPGRLGQALDVRSYSAAVSGYKSNLERASLLLKTSEATLGDTGDLAQRAYTLAVAAANAPMDQNARAAMATEVDDLRRRLVTLGNTKMPDGTAIFAGQKSDITPFTLDTSGALVYGGARLQIQVESGPDATTAATVDGSSLFTTLYARLTRLRDALEGGDVTTIADKSIADLKNSARAVDLLRGDVGSGLQSIESLATAHTRRLDDLKSQGSDIEDVDLSEAIVRYKIAESAYQAALQVTSQGAKLSLMDYLR